jgi:NAD+ synthase
MNPQVLAESISQWIYDRVTEAKGTGCVLGLSGGIDAAVTSVLCKMAFPKTTLGLIMPCHSAPEDTDDALLAAEAFQIPTKIVDLGPIYDNFVAHFKDIDPFPEPKGLSLVNIKPRLRMITLYHFAAKYNRLVVGTSNRSELTIGYFTKYGDGGSDLLPLGGLVKTHVWELARYLEIPEKIIEKPPTAGLWQGQTDEAEMGMGYADLDNFILTGEARPEIADKIRGMHARSEHKRKRPPIPKIPMD